MTQRIGRLLEDDKCLESTTLLNTYYHQSITYLQKNSSYVVENTVNNFVNV